MQHSFVMSIWEDKFWQVNLCKIMVFKNDGRMKPSHQNSLDQLSKGEEII